MNVQGRKDLGQHDSGAQNEVHGGQDDRERALPLCFASCLPIAREDGDKGDGGGAADQEVRDHVGQHEGGVQGVGLHPLPKQPNDILNPHKTDDA